MRYTTAATMVALALAVCWCIHDYNRMSVEVAAYSTANTCFETTKRPACGYWATGTDTAAYRGGSK